MGFWTKIYSRATNLWRQQTRPGQLAENSYLPYFDSDNFPLQWHKAISESPSATACVSTIQDFLEGFGFSDPALEKKQVNSRGETMFQIHQKTCKDFGEFEGFVWHFMYSRAGKITEWSLLPFENVRLGKPDSHGYINKILYNPFFGTNEYQTVKKETIFYDVFNPSAVAAQIAEQGDKYKGQVLFVGTTNALSRFYPLPEAHSAVKSMKTEAGVGDYHEDNVNNGLLQPFMLLMKGDPNGPVNNPTDTDTEVRMTQAEALNEVISENFMGAKRVGNMWVHWTSTTPEEHPSVLTFPTNNTGDYFISLANQCTKTITVAFKVPAILANINEGVSLGGDGNTVRVAVKLMQQRVIKKQRILTDAYQGILQNFDVPYVQEITIAPYNPYPELEVIDDKIWNEMSRDERRDWIEKNTEIVLVDGPVPTEAPIPQQNGFSNKIPTGWPESIRNKVKKAMDYQVKMNLPCSSRGGKILSEAIINNENLGFKDLKRIYNYLKRNEKFENALYSEGCEAVSYHAWGGKEMESFLEKELQRLNTWLN